MFEELVRLICLGLGTREYKGNRCKVPIKTDIGHVGESLRV